MSPKNLRVFVAVPRSGSTLFMRIMANCNEAAVTSRNVLMGNMKPRKHKLEKRSFKPDFSIFYDSNHSVYEQLKNSDARILISKEEFGNDRFTGTKELNECNYDIFPSENHIARCKPIFTFRNPLEVFSSWLSLGWNDLESFLIAYKKLISDFETSITINSDTFFYTYDDITNSLDNQCLVFQSICDYWGLTFSKTMLHFESEFGLNFIYSNRREKDIYINKQPRGIFDSLIKSREIIKKPSKKYLLSKEIVNSIYNSGIMDEYLRIQYLADKNRIKTVLA